MIFIGIDPGRLGAVAVYPEDDMARIKIHPCPVVNIGKGKVEYLERDMFSMLKSLENEEVFCVLEKVHAFPGQAGNSMFSMGVGYGLWRMALTVLSIPYELVSPQRWRKEMIQDVSGDNLKTKSILSARRLFPSVSLLRTAKSRKDDDNFAEALLLAEYARRTYRKGGSESGIRV